jgi:hypothetical protein
MSCAVRRIIAAATITAGLLVTAASAATQTEPFTAVFFDRPCGAKLCGNGVIDPFGPVTTITVFFRPRPGPEPGCYTYKGTRTATLAKNRRSTLRFAIQGPACGAHAWGTFRIVSGTGKFSNAGGSGIVWGAPSVVHYYGVIRLDR